MFGRKCSSPGYGFVSGIFILFFIFLAALSANLHCGKTLGLEKSFEHGKVFQAYRWETLGPLRRGKRKHLWYREEVLETGTYHWEGRKPFIQTFERFLVILWFVHVYPGLETDPKNWDLMVVNLGWCITRGHLPHSAGLFHMAITHWFTIEVESWC